MIPGSELGKYMESENHDKNERESSRGAQFCRSAEDHRLFFDRRNCPWLPDGSKFFSNFMTRILFSGNNTLWIEKLL